MRMAKYCLIADKVRLQDIRSDLITVISCMLIISGNVKQKIQLGDEKRKVGRKEGRKQKSMLKAKYCLIANEFRLWILRFLIARVISCMGYIFGHVKYMAQLDGECGNEGSRARSKQESMRKAKYCLIADEV